MNDDWFDPVGDDEDAGERERRRREREERRRGRLAQRVQQVEAEAPPPQVTAATEGGTPRPPPAAQRAASMRRRRIAGLVAVLVVVGIVVGLGVVVANRLTGDPPPPPALQTISVTIPEGYDRAQIAEIARDAGLRGDYEDETIRSRGLSPLDYGAKAFPDLEGFLFPATYELEKGARVQDLVERQLRTFKERIRGVEMSYARSKNLTVYDVVTIASMIEREVQVPEERKLVSAVIYNRLHEGMPLGIDATLRFALGNFDQQLTESELASDSPYNTRNRPGLPPGPIGNPGLDALEAAAKPAKVDYLFFVVKPGTCGEHLFTASEDEFLAAEERYQSALQAEGGSPTEC